MADPTIQEYVTYAGMAAGAAIAALVVRLGWKRGADTDTRPKELMVTGQAAITDMAPIRDLVLRVDRTAAALEDLASTTKAFVAEVRAEKQSSDREEEIERRAQVKAEKLLRDAEEAKEGRRRRPSGTTP